jgi:bifunctional polynucleotide phosphatase/kinase
MVNKEIVIVMGFPASGKSTVVQTFVDQGYTRLNRDSVGGSMDELTRLAEKTLLDTDQLVLDNLYPSVKSRAPIVALAKQNKIPIRCYMMDTSLEDAQLNACLRMIRKYGSIPEDFKTVKDPNTFPPAVIYKYRKEFQQPTVKEGFQQVLTIPFVRTWGRNTRTRQSSVTMTALFGCATMVPSSP